MGIHRTIPSLLLVLGFVGCAALPEDEAADAPDEGSPPVPPAIAELEQSPSGQFLHQPIPLPHRPTENFVKGGQLVSEAEVTGTIGFPPGGALLDDAALEDAQEIVEELRRSDFASAFLAGFARAPGSPGHARALSEHRALVLREALVASGIHPARLHTVGYGSDIEPPTSGPDQVWWAILK